MPSLWSLPVGLYNAIHKTLRRATPASAPSPELKEIQDHVAKSPSDISDHLATLYSETLAVQPRLIVELGVRGGESRFALERAAKASNCVLVSVDIEDCTAVCTRSPLWHFVKSDDVEFAREFERWCTDRAIEPKIDVLFIDTSHLYEHTVQEIKEWFPYLCGNCKVMFHDTNTKSPYRRQDGTLGLGWDSKRGVIQAIEEYLGAQLNERIHFVTMIRGWLIRHWAHCNGLTLMERTGLPRGSREHTLKDTCLRSAVHEVDRA